MNLDSVPSTEELQKWLHGKCQGSKTIWHSHLLDEVQREDSGGNSSDSACGAHIYRREEARKGGVLPNPEKQSFPAWVNTVWRKLNERNENRN